MAAEMRGVGSRGAAKDDDDPHQDPKDRADPSQLLLLHSPEYRFLWVGTRFDGVVLVAIPIKIKYRCLEL